MNTAPVILIENALLISRKMYCQQCPFLSFPFTTDNRLIDF